MNFLELTLDLIYPPKCMVCNKIIALNKARWLCDNCKNLLEYTKEPKCIKCSRPVQKEKSFCTQCANKDFSFCKNFSVYEYYGVLQSIIYKFKYGNNPNLGKGLAKLMVENLGLEFFKDFDFLVPVPLHKRKLRKRGFNQAGVLCKEISKLTGVKSLDKLLIRKKNTKSLSRLSPRERVNNLKGAFHINQKYKNNNIESRSFLIIDDIYTTGSTMNFCSKILVENGAKNVCGLTIAIVVKKDEDKYSNDIFGN